MKRNKTSTVGTVQKGKPKSVALTPDERLKLEAFPLASETQEATAGRLNVSRLTYLRVRMSGTGRFDSIEKIKKVLSNLPVPEPDNLVPNIVEQK